MRERFSWIRICHVMLWRRPTRAQYIVCANVMFTYNFLSCFFPCFSLPLLLLSFVFILLVGRLFQHHSFRDDSLPHQTNYMSCSCVMCARRRRRWRREWRLTFEISFGIFVLSCYSTKTQSHEEKKNKYNCDVIHVIPFPLLSKYFGFRLVFFFLLRLLCPAKSFWLQQNRFFLSLSSVLDQMLCNWQNWIHFVLWAFSEPKDNENNCGRQPAFVIPLFSLDKTVYGLIGDYLSGQQYDAVCASFAIRNRNIYRLLVEKQKESGLLTSSKLSSICSNIVSGKSGPAAMWMVLQNKIWKSLAENVFFYFVSQVSLSVCYYFFICRLFRGDALCKLNRLNVIHLTRYQGNVSFFSSLVFLTQKR